MTTIAFTLMFSAVLQTSPAPAPDAWDPRWSAWLGCWQLVDESVQDPEALVDAQTGLVRSRATPGVLVCVTPSADRGVTLTTWVDDKAVLTETVLADGTERPLNEPDCKGWQRAEWSPLATRLYAQAEVGCANQPLRKVSGLSMMIIGPSWIDVQMIESDGRKNLRVRRYFRAPSQARAGNLRILSRPATPLSSRMSLADVKEANGKVAPETLQATLVEIGRGFDLKSKQLIELDAAGVPDSIIDLMVALSYPKRFVVERAQPSSGSWAGGLWGTSAFEGLWPYYSDPFFYTSYYAPFGYRYWGYYDPFYFQGPGFVNVSPSAPTLQPSGDGRVVDGHGYTRVRRNLPEPSQGANGSTGGWGTSSASGGNSGSGNSGVSSGGYSSGGNSGGERTAQPRPPG